MFPAGHVRAAAKIGARGRWLACVLTAAAVAPTTATAAEPPVTFSIPAKPLSAGLIDFAVQALISIGLQHLGSCGAVVRALSGRFRVQDGLRRILAASGCDFRRIDERAFDIVSRPVRR